MYIYIIFITNSLNTKYLTIDSRTYFKRRNVKTQKNYINVQLKLFYILFSHKLILRIFNILMLIIILNAWVRTTATLVVTLAANVDELASSTKMAMCRGRNMSKPTCFVSAMAEEIIWTLEGGSNRRPEKCITKKIMICTSH